MAYKPDSSLPEGRPPAHKSGRRQDVHPLSAYFLRKLNISVASQQHTQASLRYVVLYLVQYAGVLQEIEELDQDYSAYERYKDCSDVSREAVSDDHLQCFGKCLRRFEVPALRPLLPKLLLCRSDGRAPACRTTCFRS